MRTSADHSEIPADIAIRVAARLVDDVILAIIAGTLGKLVGFGFDWLFASAGIVLLYFTLLDVSCGATLGKMALGLRVIGPDGGRPTFREAIIREAFTVIGAIPYIGPLAALATWVWIVLSIQASTLKQGKHDLVAGGTRVVQNLSARKRFHLNL